MARRAQKIVCVPAAGGESFRDRSFERGNPNAESVPRVADPVARATAETRLERHVRSQTTSFHLALLALALLAPLPTRADEGVPCATAATPMTPVPLQVTRSLLEAARPQASARAELAGFDIVLVPGAGLAADPAALAAFERAAARWEAVIADPIVVTIAADFADIGNPGIIGQSSSVLLQGPYDAIRDAMVSDGDAEGDDGILAALPAAAKFAVSLPAGFSLTGNVLGTKANLKALGFTDLDASFGTTDATITFNSTFSFDLDSSDGVDPGTIDFETTAVHELGHALGFLSSVDFVDGGSGGLVWPNTLDLERFANGTSRDPSSPAQFASFARSMIPGADAIVDDVDAEWRMSTGLQNGDGRQASHWKDDGLTGAFVGIMDPTLPSATVEAITLADLRALDLIGYDIAIGSESLCGAAPEPAASCFLQSQPLGATVSILDRADDAKDQLQWVWNRGAATSIADFGDPLSAATRFELCVYDASGSAQPLHASRVAGGGTCGAKPCWKALGTKGFAYSSKGNSHGITQLQLKAGGDGRAQVRIKGKGLTLAPPDPALTPPVTFQLIRSDGASTRCWQTTFASLITRNDDEQLKAKGP